LDRTKNVELLTNQEETLCLTIKGSSCHRKSD